MAALENHPTGRDHAVLALAAAQPRPLLDSEQGHFRAAAENRENRHILKEIQRIIAPFSRRNHASIQSQNAVELGAVERDLHRWRHVTRSLFSKQGSAV